MDVIKLIYDECTLIIKNGVNNFTIVLYTIKIIFYFYNLSYIVHN